MPPSGPPARITAITAAATPRTCNPHLQLASGTAPRHGGAVRARLILLDGGALGQAVAGRRWPAPMNSTNSTAPLITHAAVGTNGSRGL